VGADPLAARTATRNESRDGGNRPRHPPPRSGQARRAPADRFSLRPGHVRRARRVHRRPGHTRRRARRRARAHRRPPGSGRRRGLHRARRLDRHRRGRQALPARAARAPRTGAARVHARRRRAPAHEQAERAQAERPPGAGRAFGHRADGVPGPRPVGRSRRVDGAALGLRRHDHRFAALQRRSAARQGRDRRRRDEGGARRAESARRDVGRRSQPGRRRRRSPPRAATSRTFPPTRGPHLPTTRAGPTPARAGSTICST
jgi:hypothetical protein